MTRGKLGLQGAGPLFGELASLLVLHPGGEGRRFFVFGPRAGGLAELLVASGQIEQGTERLVEGVALGEFLQASSTRPCGRAPLDRP